MRLFGTTPVSIMRLRFFARDPITGAVGTRSGADELAVEMRNGDGDLVGVYSLTDAAEFLRIHGYRALLLVPGVWVKDGQPRRPLWSHSPSGEVH